MSQRASIIARNVHRVRERIAAAADRGARDVATVRLIGVTKYVDVDDARRLMEAGVVDIGESRPQELLRKAAALVDLPVVWHLIGHWQTNKIARTLPHVGWLHSGDRLKLLEAVDEACRASRRRLDLLIEVNISGDPTKHGFSPDAIEPLLPKMAMLSGLRFRGLMAMSGLHSDQGQVRREFAAVRQLRDRLRDVSPPELTWDELSMGMSDDYEIAIEEGATMVRIGSALFEGLVE